MTSPARSQHASGSGALQALNAARLLHSPRHHALTVPWSSVCWHGLAGLGWVGVLVVLVFDPPGGWAWLAAWFLLHDGVTQGLVCWLNRDLVRGGRPGSDEPVVAPDGLRLAVIVAAHNEAAVLPTTIAGLRSQSRPPDLIVIADDGSTDATAQVLSERFALLAARAGEVGEASPRVPGLCWMRLAHGGKAAALNAAIAVVEADIVLTVDADTWLEPGALQAVVSAFAADERLVAATGVLTPVCAPTASGRPLQWFQQHEYLRNFMARRAWMNLGGLLLISGAFAAFRCGPLREVGGFDPDCLVEDYEVIHRLRRVGAQRRLGWRTAVLGDAQARTEAPASALSFLRQRRRWYAGFLQTQWWYRDMVGARRYGAVGMRMLPLKALDTVQPLIGLASWSVLMWSLARGRLSLAAVVASCVGVKAVFDLACQAWLWRGHRRWRGEFGNGAGGLTLLGTLMTAVIEPWTFQLLRLAGGVWGWAHFLTGRQHWDRSSRGGLPVLDLTQEQT